MRVHNRTKFFTKKRSWKSMPLLIPVLLFCILFLIVPLVFVIVRCFQPFEDGASWKENWEFIDNFIFRKILFSFFFSFLATVICVFIGFPFAYFLNMSKNKRMRATIIMLVSAPIWMSFLIKLVGLKTFFDLCYQRHNATHGNIFTLIGLVYIYLPFMILPIYNSLSDIQPNLIYASKDLGYNSTQTFFRVTLAQIKIAISAGVGLVFLPCLTTVAVPEFLNNNNDASFIGDIIYQKAKISDDQLNVSRACVLSLVLGLILLFCYSAYFSIPKIIRKIRKSRGKNV